MLHLKVSSPRIVFFDCLRYLGRSVKIALALAAMVGLGVALRYGWQKLFVENQEFVFKEARISTDEGKEARFLTYARFKEKTGLDLKKTIFAIDTDEMAEALAALPEIKSANVTRRLPGILKVTVSEREPAAWLACPSLNLPGRDRARGLLVDRDGVPFRCDSDELWQFCEELPVILIPVVDQNEISEGVAISHLGLTKALALINLAPGKLETGEQPARVLVKDEILLEMKTRNGTVATLSYYDHERQLENLVKVISHATRRGKDLAQVNLIPKDDIPVHYARKVN